MIHEQNANAFCREEISKIENYEQAINDKTQTWHCHHRAEVLPCGRFSINDLKKYSLYFHRPASELIFLLKSDHIRLHFTGKKWTDESKSKISQTRKERIASGDIVVDNSACHTPEVYAKISAKAKERLQDKTKCPMYGKHHTEEAKTKISAANSGKTLSDETKAKISEGVKAAMTDEVCAKISASLKGNTYVKGKHWKCRLRTKPAWNKGKKISEKQKAKLRKPKSEEQKQKMRENRLGCRWYNNGTENRLFKLDTAPEGWSRGRIMKASN